MTGALVTLPGLLVSVRSAEEASAAIAGGADLIDVKEPARGALGRADDAVVADVIRVVAERRPVSAALGEWIERPTAAGSVPAGLAYAKWGLAGLAGRDTARILMDVRAAAAPAGSVLVAYADSERVGSLEPEGLMDWACRLGFSAFLIDTAIKDGSSLLDWLTADTLARIVHRVKAAHVRIALAGALTLDLIRELAPMAPDWFAVRSAACRGGRRDQPVCPDRIRELKAVISASRTSGRED